MIKKDFLRLGKLARLAMLEKLRQPANLAIYDGIISEYQSNSDGMVFQVGRAKLESSFPNIGVEIRDRQDQWIATAHTHSVRLTFDVFIAVKAYAGSARPGDTKPDEIISTVEDYIIDLAEFTFELLNQPGTLQYKVEKDSDGTVLKQPLQIYDSHADSIHYSYLYNGALRTAQIQWWAEVAQLGPTGLAVAEFQPPA